MVNLRVTRSWWFIKSKAKFLIVILIHHNNFILSDEWTSECEPNLISLNIWNIISRDLHAQCTPRYCFSLEDRTIVFYGSWKNQIENAFGVELFNVFLFHLHFQQINHKKVFVLWMTGLARSNCQMILAYFFAKYLTLNPCLEYFSNPKIISLSNFPISPIKSLHFLCFLFRSCAHCNFL